MRYTVHISRASYAGECFEVEANSPEEAEEKAIAMASDHEWHCHDYDYEVMDVQPRK